MEEEHGELLASQSEVEAVRQVNKNMKRIGFGMCLLAVIGCVLFAGRQAMGSAHDVDEVRTSEVISEASDECKDEMFPKIEEWTQKVSDEEENVAEKTGEMVTKPSDDTKAAIAKGRKTIAALKEAIKDAFERLEQNCPDVCKEEMEPKIAELTSNLEDEQEKLADNNEKDATKPSDDTKAAIAKGEETIATLREDIRFAFARLEKNCPDKCSEEMEPKIEKLQKKVAEENDNLAEKMEDMAEKPSDGTKAAIEKGRKTIAALEKAIADATTRLANNCPTECVPDDFTDGKNKRTIKSDKSEEPWCYKVSTVDCLNNYLLFETTGEVRPCVINEEGKCRNAPPPPAKCRK